MIIATAGHIDHGKSTVVRALTGVDTDRLPEEKARGISIDLGFAYWHLASGEVVGFVDVPGHERFLRNMLAGVCGIDFALIVVAADDGVMPQTVEHLQILDLLQVRRGLVVVSKIDRVSAGRADQVALDVRTLLEGTALEGIDTVNVSATQGIGIDRLRDRIAAAAAAPVHAERNVGDRFRFAVDRSFAVRGSGTVVTGTVFSGSVASGDHVTASPQGVSARIRAIQRDGSKLNYAQAGQRCALNLVGLDHTRIRRGDWVLDPELHEPSRLLDVRLRVLKSEAAALKHWTPVHLHIGTADVLARVAIRRGGAVAPGERAHARIVMQEPVVAGHGDRFIVRDQSGRRTLGGGVVIDPLPPLHRRHTRTREEQLLALERDDPQAVLQGLKACSPCGVSVGWFERSFGLSREAAIRHFEQAGMALLDRASPMAFAPDVLEDVARRIGETLKDSTAGDGGAASGADIRELQQYCAPGWSDETFLDLLRLKSADLKFEIKGARVSSLAQTVRTRSADEAIWQRLEIHLKAAGVRGLTIAELADAAGISKLVLSDVLHRLAHDRRGAFVAPDRFYATSTLDQVARRVEDLAAEQPDGRFTAAQARDRLGTNRALAVQILECLDRRGVTLRTGNSRVLRHLHEAPASAHST